ncbi:MAG: Na+/H+ antiporter subunit E [Kiritimatiellae bacterium]|nr:Na+/H+ antiporter subunit E [Kiritimatiellia bacterium]
MKQAAMFLLLLLLWVVLVWPFAVTGGRVHLAAMELVPGVIVALLVVLIMRHSIPEGFKVWINPVRLFWFVVYAGVFVFYVIKANFDVAYRIIHPAMPIHPGIVKVKTTLKTRAGIAMLSNAIALTPGTLTVHAEENGDLYVHWINVKATDVDGATGYIVRRFEWLIKRIME